MTTRRVYHVTPSDVWPKILASGALRPGRDGVVNLTDDAHETYCMLPAPHWVHRGRRGYVLIELDVPEGELDTASRRIVVAPAPLPLRYARAARWIRGATPETVAAVRIRQTTLVVYRGMFGESELFASELTATGVGRLLRDADPLLRRGTRVRPPAWHLPPVIATPTRARPWSPRES